MSGGERRVSLSVTDHDRAVAGLRYVYPVLSRRAHGLSVGINLNPNNACNWRCVYCQVPGLVRGKAPVIDLGVLEGELGELFEQVCRGDALERWLPPEARRLADLAFSGNGEPTSCRQLVAVVEVVGGVLERFGLRGALPVTLITNGSLVGRPWVDEALGRLAALGGRVWFKLDRVTAEGLALVASTPVEPEQHLARLRRSASLCPTWAQSCCFALDGRPPDERELAGYVDAVAELCAEHGLRGVLLYGLARPSTQPEAPRLAALSVEWFEAFAARLRARGVNVETNP